MNNYVLITGGRVDKSALDSILKTCRKDTTIVAVDKGLEYCRQLEIVPDVAVGDFDSADNNTVAFYRSMSHGEKKVEFVELDTHKDITDTHAALIYAMDHGATDIFMVGATGTRLDHTMANIGLLKACTDRRINGYIVDDHNIITMINGKKCIRRIKGYPYISLIPYGGRVTDVTLTGFEYNVRCRSFEVGDSLGISNSITSDNGCIDFTDGYMIVDFSRD